jgi:hypothetical protein
MLRVVVEEVVQCAIHAGILDAIENYCGEDFINLKFTKYCMGLPASRLAPIPHHFCIGLNRADR